MLTLSLNILNRVFICAGRRWSKRILVSVWKFYPSTQLRRRKSTGRDSRCHISNLCQNLQSLPKRKWVISSTNMITNMPAPDHLDELLCHLQCFSKHQRKKDRSDFEPDTMSSFQKTPASHWRVNFYSALSFDRIYLNYVCKPWGLGCWLCLSRF